MPYQKLPKHLRPLAMRSLPSAPVPRQTAHLAAIREYPESAVQFNNVSSLSLVLKAKNSHGHQGAKLFWKHNLKTVAYWNPALPINVTRVNCITKEEQEKCPAILKAVLKSGEEVVIDCKDRQHQDIMKELFEKAQGEKVDLSV
ncbi:mitochondrial 54S ribosomal protein [Martiniozyma asiatica (nom. inval.)]|nr:mitochondrial 54S ribosomal protein [Martiniozyma asiatica]